MDEKELAEFLTSLTQKISPTNLPPNIYSTEEMVLSSLLLKYLDINSKELMEYKSTISKIIDELKSLPEIDQIEKNIDSLISKDIVGSWLQHSYKKEIRKSTASNYTEGIDQILSTLKFYDYQSIMDPFCGSGRLITNILKYMSSITTVIINDLSPTAVIIAYTRIKYLHPKVKIIATIGDAFVKTDAIADLIIINPPFTRVMRISEEIRNNIKNKLSLNKIGHEGLHIYSLKLCHNFLKPNGMLISVLPASTIASTYSKEIQKLLLTDYDELQILQESNRLSFSENSEFNEIMLIGIKSEPTKDIVFEIIDNYKISIKSTELAEEWNWMRFFRDSKLIETQKQLAVDFNLTNAKSLEIEFIRGIELYGPNFYFFPNKFHQSFNINNGWIIFEDKCRLPLKVIKLVLRQPKFYKFEIEPEVAEYTLDLPETYTELFVEIEVRAINEYLQKHKDQAKIAKKRFGSSYFHHINQQIMTKNPQGHLFLTDKLDLKASGTLLHYTPKSQLCTKNFYVANLTQKQSKLVAAWMSTSLYLLLYLSFRRELNNTYGRMQIIDYDKISLFPNLLFELSKSEQNEIEKQFDILKSDNMVSLTSQEALEKRETLDYYFIKIFKSKLSIDEIQSCIQTYLKKLTKQ